MLDPLGTHKKDSRKEPLKTLAERSLDEEGHSLLTNDK
jgi:hypothetical protein